MGMGDRKVAIVGAGCAGLSAAYTLKRRGVEAVVFEALGVGQEV
jgi:protoporphyrinogen oxidase